MNGALVGCGESGHVMLSPSLRFRVNSAKPAAGGLFLGENKQKQIPRFARDDIAAASFINLLRSTVASLGPASFLLPLLSPDSHRENYQL